MVISERPNHNQCAMNLVPANPLHTTHTHIHTHTHTHTYTHTYTHTHTHNTHTHMHTRIHTHARTHTHTHTTHTHTHTHTTHTHTHTHTHSEALTSEDDYHECWVTVFGFPHAASSYILEQFSQYGTILKHSVSTKYRRDWECSWT